MTRQHPSQPLLMAYAMGNLPGLHSLVLRIHVEHCTACQHLMRSMDEIGGAMFASLQGADLDDDALTRLLKLVDETGNEFHEVKPDTLSSLAIQKWRWVAPGIQIMPVAERDATGTRLDLIRVSAGTALPVHDHADLETTCVLQGRFSDVSGEYRLHDIQECGPGQVHAPTAAEDGDCICILAITQRLRPQNMLARLVHQFLDF
jgi:putative transcriptional regulator